MNPSRPDSHAKPAPPAPPHHKKKKKTSLVRVVVIDGDTGQRLSRAVVTISRGSRRGRTLFALNHRHAVRATVWAPHYGTRTLTLAFDRFRSVKVRLYRPDGQWPMYGANPARTQGNPAIHLRPPFRIVWGRRLGNLIEFPASISDGVAYVSTLRGKLFALSMANGRILWHFDLHSWEQASSPAISGESVVAHTKAGRVFVLDRATGRQRWTWPAAGGIESSPVVRDGVDYFGDSAGYLYALDLRRHRLLWTAHTGCKITAAVALVGDRLYVGDYCGRLLALSTRGRLLFSASAGSPVYGSAAVAGGRVFVPSRDAGALYAFTTRGRTLWSVRTGSYVYSAPAVWQGRVFFGSYNGYLYGVSASSGRVLWTAYAGGRVSGSPAVIDGIVYAGSFGHQIIGVDARTGRVVFRFPHGEYVPVSGNRGRLLLYGWSSLWAVESTG
jgi:outer membrane protein assembly factor BamB